jgi:hypothetical protein
LPRFPRRAAEKRKVPFSALDVTHFTDRTPPAAGPTEDDARVDFIRRVVELYRRFRPESVEGFRAARNRARAALGRRAQLIGHPQLDGSCRWQVTIRGAPSGDVLAKTQFHADPSAAVEEALEWRRAH